MKALVKYQTYTMTLLAGVLFIVGTVTGADQTGISTGGNKQGTKKPTIMILGSAHLASWGGHGINYKMDDMLAPKRQRELQQLVDQLAQFKPTKIAVEVDARGDAETQAEYDTYLSGDFQLERHEIHQIGFRLAKQMGHPKVYCVDHFRNYSKEPDAFFPENFDWDLVNYSKFAKSHNQEHLFGSHPRDQGKVTRDKDGAVWIEREYEHIIDMYIRLNQPERSRASHQAYLHNARIGLGDQYPGANWVAHLWYARNLKIFVNLTRITELAEDRILFIVGTGHIFLVQQLLEDSGDYIVESPLKYLHADDAENRVSEEID